MFDSATSEDTAVLTWRGRDPLSWLLAPRRLDEFLAHDWERQALVLEREEAGYYRDLLTFDDVNAFMSRNDIRYPYLRLVKNGRELPLVDYADDFVYGNNVFPGLLDNDKVFHHYSEGATLSFQIFQKCMDELSNFCNALEARLRFQTQVNIFVTPPGSKGFTAHYDDHSFFILQVSGKKHWKVYGSPTDLPLQEFRRRAVTPELEEPREITLSSGDLLYLPRGFYHEAHTSDETSVHITLGIFPFTWIQVLQRLLDEAKQDVEFRRAPGAYLSPGTSAGVLQGEFEDLVRKLGSLRPVEQLFSTLFRQAASKQIVDGRNRLRDLTDLAKLDADTWLTMRPVHWCLRSDAGAVALIFYDKTIRLPSAVEATLREILALERFRPCDLRSALDQTSRLNLIRKLVKEGLLSFNPA